MEKSDCFRSIAKLIKFIEPQKVIKVHKVDFALLIDAFDDFFGVYFEDLEHSTDEEIRFDLIGFSARYGLIYVTFDFLGNKLSVVSREGLIKMKTLAGRPQDLAAIGRLENEED